ncbi:MAG: N-acyl-D-amino-acid deacylase family protein [Candidatus Acetothermia bacterium]
MYDLFIKNGKLVDGTGASVPVGHVGVQGEEIKLVEAARGEKDGGPEARSVINASGKLVCPGFIDMHAHGDFSLFERPFMPDKIWQGITTHTTGHCGFSLAPVSQQLLDNVEDVFPSAGLTSEDFRWESFAEYLAAVEKQPLGPNLSAFVGYAPVRMAVMGLSGEKANLSQIEQMQDLLARALEEGAFGFTTGLAYPPQVHATTDELVALSEVVAEHHRLYATHIRDATYDVAGGVREAVEIAQKSGVDLHIAHMQMRPTEEHDLQEVLDTIQEAKDVGIDVTFDQYPYLAGQGPLTPLFPDWSLDGPSSRVLERFEDPSQRAKIKEYMAEVVEDYFRWHEIILWADVGRDLIGRSVQTVAHLQEKDPRDVIMDVISEHGLGIRALYFGKTEEELRAAATWPEAMVGTDGVYVEEERHNHPRTFGTFPRMIRKYALEQNSLSVEEAISRMTSLPAARLGLGDRGVLEEGRKADILIIDPDRLRDTATYEDPIAQPEGFDCVIVNGQIVRRAGTDRRISAGKVLRPSG